MSPEVLQPSDYSGNWLPMNPLRGLSALKAGVIELVGAGVRTRVRLHRARFLKACEDSRRTQSQTLNRILSLNSDSKLSRDYQLQPDMTVDEFRERFPISDYDLFEPYIAEMKRGDHQAMIGSQNKLLMFALSSGTTSESKFIPITKSFLQHYRWGWKIWGIGAIDEYPGCDRGHIFQISSSQTRFQTEAGTPCGNISGLVSSMQPSVLQRLYTLPKEVAYIEDPDTKYYTVLRIALADETISWVTTANPGTLVKLADLMNEHAPELIEDIRSGQISAPLSEELRALLDCQLTRPNPERAEFLERLYESSGGLTPEQCWPNLKLLSIWTGGSAGAYLPRIRELFGDVPIHDHGLHASEGRMTIPLHGGTSEGVLDITAHFFEFIPEDNIDDESPKTLLADELKPGENYFILLTTDSGLYRYDIRDVVKCTGFEGTTPVLTFLHKGANISSITGEKVTESQVVQAAREASESMALTIPQFIVAPGWGEPPGYRFLMETNAISDHSMIEELVTKLDAKLCELNIEYAEKRQSGRLSPLKAQNVPAGTMENLAQSRNERRKGSSMEQYKHPCLIPDLEFLEQLSGIESPETSLVNR